ncbi:hypothetical protein BFL35_13710 [Clavibacter michiganensis]|jgi:hypothetical protein|uniref:Uncharacterized protein n=1 Tax=Clavibacter capsici TaxID=1874630 RepID=A0AAE6XRW5_9MICO|nr:hypothetical protein [Clavibacter capsici]ALD13896.1 hypothetical protein AES38_14115 [Clavibacter capsici]OUE29711.1 hypothetical protein BFL35_13710 [Clavibacter michiganensis]QIS46132.1 hypothetical protein GW570_14115 [Clavibacter capsici]
MVSEVWIVQHDESPDNTVLGVFATREEAHDFAEEVTDRFPNGALTTHYPIGFRYDRGTRQSTYEPQD